MSDEGQPSTPSASEEGTSPPAADPSIGAETPAPSAPPPPDMSGDGPPPSPPPPPDSSGYGSVPPPPSGEGSTAQAPPEYSQPDYAQPDPAQPGYSQPDYAQPDPAQPGYSQPGYSQPDPAQPDYSQPGYSQPGYAQPDPAQQGYAPPPAVPPMANMAGAGVADDTGSAVVAQVLALFTGILGTGIYYAVSNDKSPFVRHHVTEALNFSITLAIAWTATFVLSIVLIGFLIMPFLMLWGFIMPILAAVAANKGEWYRYPATLRLVKGPLDQPGGVQGYGGQGY